MESRFKDRLLEFEFFLLNCINRHFFTTISRSQTPLSIRADGHSS